LIGGIKKMIYVVQLFLFCGLFTALVAVGTGGRAINEIYFYPKPVQDSGAWPDNIRNRLFAVCCDCSNYGGTYRADILTNAGVDHYDDQ